MMKEIRFDPPRPKDAPDDRDSIDLPIMGEVYYAYRPTTNATALFYAAMGKRNNTIRLAAIEEFLEHSLEPEAFSLIMKAVRNDEYDYDKLVPLIQAIIAEFGENPTGSSSASSPSRPSTGTASTGNSRRPASTRAPSPSRASAV